MTFVSDRKARTSPDISRRELVFWLLVFLFANVGLHYVDTSSVLRLLTTLASQSLILLFASYAVFVLALRSDEHMPATGFQIALVSAVMIVILLTSFFAMRYFVGAAATVCAVVMFYIARGSPMLRRAATVLLAVSFHVVWGQVIFRFFQPYVLWLDAVLLKGAIATTGADVTVRGNVFSGAGDHSMTLVGACSSFNNVSLAALGFVAVLMYSRSYWLRSDLYWALGLAALMIAFNALRLTMFAIDPALFDFWHNGAGVEIFAFVQAATILGVSLLAARWSKPVL